jgi:hypothetical protein
MAMRALESGAAGQKLEAFIALSQSLSKASEQAAGR